MKAEAIHRAVGELRKAECEVTALRCSAVPESLVELAETAARERIARVVAPLSCATEEHASITAGNGVALSVHNAVVGSEYASRMLSEFRAQGGRCGFTFNAANFARAGEKPFLYSYKQPLRRFVDQLDVEDCRFDGTVQPLARGNAEIKEMISMQYHLDYFFQKKNIELKKGSKHDKMMVDIMEYIVTNAEDTQGVSYIYNNR